MTDPGQNSETLEWLGVTYKTILGSDQTGGAISIVDSLSPAGTGPARHVHHNEDETFVILSGACRVWIEGQETLLNAGESTFIPRDSEHTFQATGTDPCRHLVILTPGGFEGFFADMAQGKYSIPDDMPAIEASAARHHMTFTGPPLS